MGHLLEVRNLSAGIVKDKKILKILDNINFTVDEGEILGLAGESGCGKTMTALSVSRLLPANVKIINGEIIYKDKLITNLNEKNMRSLRGKEISVIFQETRQSLNPLIKTGKQITEALKFEGASKTDRESNKNTAIEILSLLGFNEPEKIMDSYPFQLSGGMCQRIMTAIAAVRRPSLLLADEPSSSLDDESQNCILSLLLKMNREYKMSVLLISHDLSIIMKYCSRYLIMYAGKIIEEGGDLSTPLHPYTKALLMASPDKSKSGKKLENIQGTPPSIHDSFTGCSFAPRCKKAKPVCFESFPPPIETNGRRVCCYFPEKGELNG